MRKVIDVRNMHDAIHSLYIVKSKPKTVLKAFMALDGCCCEYESDPLWNIINANTEYYGEINFRDITGDKSWRGGELISHNEYHNGDDHFVLIGSFDIY